MASLYRELADILREAGCRFERQGKAVTKSGTARSRSGPSRFRPTSTTGRWQTQSWSGRGCRKHFDDEEILAVWKGHYATDAWGGALPSGDYAGGAPDETYERFIRHLVRQV